MSADNLPRPATPGPWIVSTDDGDPSGEVVSMNPAPGTHLFEVVQTPNTLALSAADPEKRNLHAIAALPERIRRMDAVRAYCEERTRVTREHGWLGGEREAWVEASHIIALLDGGGGES